MRNYVYDLRYIMAQLALYSTVDGTDNSKLKNSMLIRKIIITITEVIMLNKNEIDTTVNNVVKTISYFTSRRVLLSSFYDRCF